MRAKIKLVTLVSLFMLLGLSTAFGQGAWEFDCFGNNFFSWQTQLSDSAGNPLPAGNYVLVYCYYEDSAATMLIGCCTDTITIAAAKSLSSSAAISSRIVSTSFAYPVPINEDVVKRRSTAALTFPEIWLEITLEGETLEPTFKLYSVPFAGVAQRINGDIVTRPGRIIVSSPEVADSARIVLSADATGASIKLYNSAGDLKVSITTEDNTITFDVPVIINNDLTVSGKATIGPNHSNTGTNSFVAGANNIASGDYSVVSGGGGPNLSDSNSASGNFSTIGGGSRNSASGLVWSTVCGGVNNIAEASVAVVGGGEQNKASVIGATVSGGRFNIANGFVSTVGGGQNNTANDTSATVSGGSNNQARGIYSVVAGGGGVTEADSNSASGDYSVIGGGSSNTASKSHSTISGGSNNTASGEGATISGGVSNNANGSVTTVGGGSTNTTSADRATVGGGSNNTVSGNGATISGGVLNIANGSVATVGGGQENTASANMVTVGGGSNNTASGDGATIGGGQDNTASNSSATVGGGDNNTASGVGSTVSGGSINAASTSSYATVGGGIGDTASAYASTVSGGQSNTASNNYSTVSGGQGNTASGYGSTVGGGFDNLASGLYSYAAGRRAKANHNGSFVWADQTDSDFASTDSNQFNVRASGGTRIFSNTALTTGVTLSAGGGAWVMVSDSTVKRNIRLVDEFDILEKVASLPISRWNYETQSPDIEHIGPMAQDFYAIFGVGEDERGISTLDPDGVSLAAIKALLKKNNLLAEEMKKLRDRIEKLEKGLNR